MGNVSSSISSSSISKQHHDALLQQQMGAQNMYPRWYQQNATGGLVPNDPYPLTHTFGALKEHLSSQSTKPEQKQWKGIMNYVKDYLVKHRELLLGVGAVILFDHFIFKGAFRVKIEKLVNNLLDKADQKLLADK